MTEKLCKNCKWWIPQEEIIEWKKIMTEGNCVYINCSTPALSGSMDKLALNGKGIITTGPNFGCIHWKEGAGE